MFHNVSNAIHFPLIHKKSMHAMGEPIKGITVPITKSHILVNGESIELIFHINTNCVQNSLDSTQMVM